VTQAAVLPFHLLLRFQGFFLAGTRVVPPLLPHASDSPYGNFTRTLCEAQLPARSPQVLAEVDTLFVSRAPGE
jgi:hypothetical protein